MFICKERERTTLTLAIPRKNHKINFFETGLGYILILELITVTTD